MKREEQIKQAAKEYADDGPDKVQSIIAQVGFEMGAQWADAHPDISMVSALAYEAGRNDAIEEACNRWISVADELPKKDENVLVCGGGRVFYGCWLGGELWAIARQPLEERLDFEITHWMALPAPPKKGGAQ